MLTLDERDLCEFWDHYHAGNGWLYEVHEGGWQELESHRPLFNSPSFFTGLREFLIVCDQCDGMEKTAMSSKRLFNLCLAIVLAALSASCSGQKSAPVPTGKIVVAPTGVTEQQAIQIAEAALSVQGDGRHESRAQKIPGNNGYTVMIEYLPHTPGAYTSVAVSRAGKVTRIMPGM